MKNSIFPTLNGTPLSPNNPAVFQKRIAVKNLIFRLIVALCAPIAIAACNSKGTSNDTPSTTNSAPGTTRNGDDDGHMGQHGEAGNMDDRGEMNHEATGGDMMGDGHDTTANDMSTKGMGMGMKHKGMGMKHKGMMGR